MMTCPDVTSRARRTTGVPPFFGAPSPRGAEVSRASTPLTRLGRTQSIRRPEPSTGRSHAVHMRPEIDGPTSSTKFWVTGV